MKIDPSDIELENLSKSFEYHKLSSEVDNCNDIDYLKNLTKAYIKLYFKQQEVVAAIGLSS